MTEASPFDSHSHWHGRTDHPLFGALTDRISPLGFSWIGAEIERASGVARWARPLFDSYSLELSLSAVHPRYLGENHFGFLPALFVLSSRQKDVWNELQIGRCLQLIPDLYVEEGDYAPPVLSIDVQWLFDTWESVERTASERPRWNRVQMADATACAVGLATSLERHLPRLLDHLSSAPALAGLLLNLEAFPGYTERRGVRCEPRNVLAAVLLHDLGRTAEAWQTLMAEERRLAATGEEVDLEMLPVVRCQNQRLKRWISTIK